MKYYDIQNKEHTLDISGVNTTEWNIVDVKYQTNDITKNMFGQIWAQTLSFTVAVPTTDKNAFITDIIGKKIHTSEYVKKESNNYSNIVIGEWLDNSYIVTESLIHGQERNTYYKTSTNTVTFADNEYAEYEIYNPYQFASVDIPQKIWAPYTNPFGGLYIKNGDNNLTPVYNMNMLYMGYQNDDIKYIGSENQYLLRGVKWGFRKEQTSLNYVKDFDKYVTNNNTSDVIHYYAFACQDESPILNEGVRPNIIIYTDDFKTFYTDNGVLGVMEKTAQPLEIYYNKIQGMIKMSENYSVEPDIRYDFIRVSDFSGVSYQRTSSNIFVNSKNNKIYYLQNGGYLTLTELDDESSPNNRIYIQSLSVNGEIIKKREEFNDDTTTFFIVSNSGNMSMNDPVEYITFDAVDYLTYIKNIPYQTQGYESIYDIIFKCVGTDLYNTGYYINEAFNTLSYKLNLDYLKKDEDNTLPSRWDVMKNVLEFLGYNGKLNSRGEFVLFSPVEVGRVLKIKSDTYLANRSISILEPSKSYEIINEYKDIENEGVDVSWDNEIEKGTMNIYNKDYRYESYKGTDGGCNRFDNITNEMQNYYPYGLSLLEKDANVESRGSMFLHIATGEITDGNDIEGSKKTEDTLLIYGLKKGEIDFSTTDIPVLSLYDLYKKTIYINAIVNNDLFIIINENFRFGEYGIPVFGDNKKIQQPFKYAMGRWGLKNIKIKLTFSDNTTHSIFKTIKTTVLTSNDVVYGNTYKFESNLTWKYNLNKEGYVINIGEESSSLQGKQLKKVEVGVNPYLYPLYNSYKHHLFGTLYFYPWLPTQYVFSDLSVDLMYKPLVDEDIIDTDTILKWNNDYAQYNGEEISVKTPFTIFDNKKYSNNMILDFTKDNGCAGEEDVKIAFESLFGEKSNIQMKNIIAYKYLYEHPNIQEEITVFLNHSESDLYNPDTYGHNNHDNILDAPIFFDDKYLDKTFMCSQYTYNVVSAEVDLKGIEYRPV